MPVDSPGAIFADSLLNILYTLGLRIPPLLNRWSREDFDEEQLHIADGITSFLRSEGKLIRKKALRIRK